MYLARRTIRGKMILWKKIVFPRTQTMSKNVSTLCRRFNWRDCWKCVQCFNRETVLIIFLVILGLFYQFRTMSKKFATFCRCVCQNRVLCVHSDFFRKVYLGIYEYFHYNLDIELKTFGFLLEIVWWGCQNYNLPVQGNKLRQINFGLLWESLRRGCQNYNLSFNSETVMTKSPFVKKVFFFTSPHEE